jgi:hypothetical protein
VAFNRTGAFKPNKQAFLSLIFTRKAPLAATSRCRSASC